MSEQTYCSNKRRRLNSPSQTYESAPVKKQKRFPIKRKSVNRVVPETPEKRRQKTLTQAAWLVKSVNFEQDDETSNVGHGYGTKAAAKNDEQENIAPVAEHTIEAPASSRTSRKISKTPARARREKDEPPDEHSGSEYGSHRKPGQKKKRGRFASEPGEFRSISRAERRGGKPSITPSLESQRTLTQLDDFLSPDTVCFDRVASLANTRARRRNEVIEAAKRQQRTLTQMVEMPGSDADRKLEQADGVLQDEEVNAPPEIEETQGEANFVQEEDQEQEQDQEGHGGSVGPDIPVQSPASRDALRVPPDLREARQKAQLATQFPYIQPRGIMSSPKKAKCETTAPTTPQRRKLIEIPSSQSPAESPLYTQKMQRTWKSPVAETSWRVILESPLKSRKQVLFRQNTTASDSSTISTQIRDGPLSATCAVRKTMAEDPLLSLKSLQEDPSGAHLQTKQHAVLTSSFSSDCSSSHTSERNDVPDKNNGFRLGSGSVESDSAMKEDLLDRVNLGRSPSVELGVETWRSAQYHEVDSADEDEPDLDLHSPLGQRRQRKGTETKEADQARAQVGSSQLSGSSEANAQLYLEMQHYTQRRNNFSDEYGAQEPMTAILPPPKCFQQNNYQQKTLIYPSQATTMDVTQFSAPSPSTAVLSNIPQSSLRTHKQEHFVPRSSQRYRRRPSPAKTRTTNHFESIPGSPIRPPDLIIPSSPASFPVPAFSSPLQDKVPESQNVLNDRTVVLQDSMGQWSMLTGPPPSSDDESLD